MYSATMRKEGSDSPRFRKPAGGRYRNESILTRLKEQRRVVARLIDVRSFASWLVNTILMFWHEFYQCHIHTHSRLLVLG